MVETLEESFGLFVSERCDYAGVNCAENMKAGSDFNALYKQAKRAAGDNEGLLAILSDLENAVGIVQYTLADACYRQGWQDAIKIIK